MKSTVLTSALMAAYASDQAHLSGGEAHNAIRHQEECDAGVVVNCQVEEGWQWNACDATCGQGHSTRERDVTVEACNGGTACPPTTQTKLCMVTVRNSCGSCACATSEYATLYTPQRSPRSLLDTIRFSVHSVCP
jgi:hypothetical protein